MADKEHHRSTDEAIGRIEAKLDAHIETFNSFKADSQDWKMRVDRRFEPIEELVNKLNTPFRIMLGVFVLVFTPIFGGIGIAIYRWVEKHFQ